MSASRTAILKDTLTLVLAGGQGDRLYPLTRFRSKPSVSFGGSYRIIDFTLSNCLNSGLRRIYVLVQYQSLTLSQHIHHGWNLFSIEIDEFINSLPPQHVVSQSWYTGTVDAIYQNVYLLNQHRPQRVLILSGDHIYKMDYYPMLEAHENHGADVTVAAVEVDLDEASRYGVIEVDAQGCIIGFQEKPARPAPVPGKPSRALCNMGVYAFNTDAMVRAVMVDAKNEKSSHDFGRDVLPKLVQEGSRVFAYRFHDGAGAKYWRDIGTLDSYYDASMDLISVSPQFNLYDKQWPLRTYMRQFPPAKTVFAQEGGRLGTALDSLISSGCILSGGKVVRSILSYNVRINSYSAVSDSILMEGVTISRHAQLRRCIVDEGAHIPEGMRIGFQPEVDLKRFSITESGVVVVPSGYEGE